MDITELQPKTLEQLRVVAREWDITAYSRLKKDDLILRLMRAKAENKDRAARRRRSGWDGIGSCAPSDAGAEDICAQSRFAALGCAPAWSSAGCCAQIQKYYSCWVETVNGIDPERPAHYPIFPMSASTGNQQGILSPPAEPDRAGRRGQRG